MTELQKTLNAMTTVIEAIADLDKMDQQRVIGAVIEWFNLATIIRGKPQ